MKFFKEYQMYIICLLVMFAATFIWQIVSGNHLKTGVSTAINIESENTSSKKIALTFDDGPHPEYTIKLLDGLKERNVKATFFIIGENAKNNPDVVKRIFEEGHTIGNHTFSHVQLNAISEEKAITEITDTNNIIKDITGELPKYIRPPYGLYSDSLKRETNLIPVLWTIDPRDWSILNTQSIVKHVINCAKNEDIILLHDIFNTSVDAALIIIDELQKQGFEFVTIDELY
jgi:peptidoglycan/xylan/chitin deacetylase (PgdA/CDA1 family)